MCEHSAVPQSALDRIAQNLADIGVVSLQEYLDAPTSASLPHTAPSPVSAQVTGPVGVNAITRLHEACQRTMRNTGALKFEFIEQAGSKNKQCILTITKPDGECRSYATQPSFPKKSEAKLEAAKIAIDMGALDFVVGAAEAKYASDPAPVSLDLSVANNVTTSDSVPAQHKPAPETPIDDIERCCLEWRAGRVTPHWIPFSDTKSTHKQGCALRIQLSQHVVRVYASDPIFDTYMEAKGTCANAAVLEGVLDFIKHGNGQTHPSSPIPSTSSTAQSYPLPATVAPWTLQAFYDSLPKPLPESFDTNDASETNAPGWLNTIVQTARGGKLSLSFFFTSDGPPGLHGCLLKLHLPGEYKAFFVDAMFPKRSDAKAAVCLQAISEGIGDYIRSIASALDAKITPAMRSFSSSVVYPALTSELSRIDATLVPFFEYTKERDAFGATLVVKLSIEPAQEQIKRYTVPNEHRTKADAKVAVICHAAEQGLVEFVRFRGGAAPDGYRSPYVLRAYDPDASSRKRKAPEQEDDAALDQAARKRTKTKRTTRGRGRRVAKHLSPADQPLVGGEQTHGISGPGDMGLSQGVFMNGSGDLSRVDPGDSSGGDGGPGAFPMGAYGRQPHTLPYPAVLDPRFAGGGRYAVRPMLGAYESGAPPAVEAPPPESGPSRAMPGSSERVVRRRIEHAELEPGEVLSSAESDFSESSSRNEEVPTPNERGVHRASSAATELKESESGADSADAEHVVGRNKDKGRARETSSADTSTTVSREGPGPAPTPAVTVSHVKKLIDYCATHGCGTPSFHETQRQGRFHVWIVIGKERFDLPTTYGSAEEGRQRVAKQVLARMCKGLSG